MTTPNEKELLETAVAAARAGGAVLARFFRDEDLEVRSKAQHDFVTEADHGSEAAVVGEIQRTFPEHHILAEESGVTLGGGDDEHRWLIDPLDGTTNFLQGLPVYAVSVACQRGESMMAAAVLDPQGGNLFTACRGGGAYWNGRPMRVSSRPGLDGAFLATGYPFRSRGALDRYLEVFRDVFRRARAIRRCGAAALDLAYTAAGVYDGFFEFRLSPWDFAAGDLLLAEAGGKLTDLDGGGDYYHSGNLVAGNPAVHEELLAVIRERVSEAVIDRLDPPSVRPRSDSPVVAGAPDS